MFYNYELTQENTNKLISFANRFTVLAGILYGAFIVLFKWDTISTIETDWVRNFGAPLLYVISGVAMAYFTRLGFTLIFWAAAKGMQGPGGIGEMFLLAGLVYLPILFATPAIPYLQTTNEPFTSVGPMLAIGLIVLAILGAVHIAVNFFQVRQELSKLKSTVSIVLAIVFFVSVFYLIN